jgi:hypothetical protein
MSKISYCSIEEAWGTPTFNNNNNDDTKKKIDDIERKNVITNMNNVERNKACENNSLVEYNKYRFNPTNVVKNNDAKSDYTPFNESIEKKFLQDKLNFLENEFRKYKHIFENNKNEPLPEPQGYLETFSNQQNEQAIPLQQQYQQPSNNNDIIDLILLIIIGLIVIFVLNSIFYIGKSIGARHRH